MTLQDALTARQQAEQEFILQLTEKVMTLKKHYANPKLNDNQKHFLKKDEQLVKSAEHLVNVCLAQIQFLISENRKQQEFMQDMHRDITKYQEMFLNVVMENSRLKEQAGVEQFKFR